MPLISKRWAILFLLLLIFSVFLYLSIQEKVLPQQLVKRTPTGTQAVLNKLGEQNRQKLVKAIENDGDKSDKTEPAHIKKVRSIFKALYEQRDSFNSDTLSMEAFAEIQHDDEAVEVVKVVLTDHKQAVQLFEGDQALVRVFGIRFLGYLAAHGYDVPLRQTIMSVWNQFLAADREPYKGDALDAEDLIVALCSNVEVVDPFEFILQLASTLNLDENLGSFPQDRKGIISFGRGIALGLGKKFPWETINSILLGLFPHSFSQSPGIVPR